jgi:hypothetical protein
MKDSSMSEHIDWVRAVIDKTRSAFLLANVSSLIVLIALFNAYASWLRHLPGRSGLGSTWVTALTRAEVSDLMVSSVPLLGLKVFGGDLGVISATAMLVLTIWLYYAYRREQHCVGRLIQRVGRIELASDESLSLFNGGGPKALRVSLSGNDPEVAEHVLWALSTSFMFTTSRIDRAVGDSGKELYPEEGPRVAVVAKSVLLFAPVCVVGFVILADIISLALPTQLSANNWPLICILSFEQRVEVLVRLLFAIGVSAMVFKVLCRAVYFMGWTQAIYRGLATAVSEAKQVRKETDIRWAD